MRRIIYGSLFFLSMAYTALLVVSNLDCLPTAKRWDPTVEGYCLPGGSTAYSSGAFNVASDIFVVCLPLPAIWSLNMRRSKKLRIMFVFSLGIMYVDLTPF